MADGITFFITCWVLTVDILCLHQDGRRSYLSCEKWLGSDMIFYAISTVLKLYNCCLCYRNVPVTISLPVNIAPEKLTSEYCQNGPECYNHVQIVSKNLT